ncbi:cell wall protein DAN4 isoform X2 [Drosophila navojoa]|uniref:cell wall protein DAN4 isoform X2 n=1 Tax=Drosophila navojoa TaxID=7232 RepID=UPI0008472011|nr:cell wall protein DAN4 isoform X2 [Drosophila navojoa]
MLKLSSLMLLTFGVLHVQMQPLQQEADENESSRALYDQRQTGKYNIHVSIKDVAIIEVDQNELADESYNEEYDDYYYDDSALTIKPIKFTTEASTTPSTAAAATTTTTTAATPPTASSAATSAATSSTPTAAQPTTVAPTAAAATSIPTPSSNMSSYSAQLLADIAATQRLRPKASNLIIMETPIGGPSTLLPKWLHARSKDEPLTTTTSRTPISAAATASAYPSHIEYTPGRGHDSPIFKVKVQRAAPLETPTRCRAHQFRDAQGKCRSKRNSGSILKLFSMLVSLPFAGNRHAHGHGLQISP